MNSAYADELRSSLSHIKRWRDTPEKAVAQKEAISNFISRCIEAEHSLKDINGEIQRLYTEEMLISKELITKAQQLAAEEYAKTNSSAALITPFTTKLSAVEPLFSKDTIYHACVCCQAVSKCNAGDYQKLFKNKEVVPGHGFEAVSFSRSKEETFLIAQNKGESTYYFAFKGRPNLSDWTKGFKCFSEGIFSLPWIYFCTIKF